MKYILLASLLICCTFTGLAQAQQRPVAPFDLNEKLNELESLREGLVVNHSPKPVNATLHSPSLSGVQWKHSTTVTSVAGPINIVEFGYFVERNGQWDFSYGTQVPLSYDSKEFSKMFECPNSILKPGKTYTNKENSCVIDCVPEQMVKWYFIGLDENGNRVKGEANVKLLAEVLD